MKNNRRRPVLLLLLMFSMAALRQGAFGAAQVNFPTSTNQSIYLITRDKASSTRFAIIQMTENEDGTLSKSSEYDGKLPGMPTTAFYCRSNGHLYLNLSNGSRSITRIAQFEFKKDGRIVPATPFILPAFPDTSFETDAGNRLVLSLDLSTGVLSLLSVDVRSGVMHLESKLNLHSVSPNKSTTKEASSKPNDFFMSAIVAHTPATYLYVSKTDFSDLPTDSILQLRITPNGKISLLNPPEIKADTGFLSEYDAVHRVLYSLNDDLRAFSVASNGQLRALMKDRVANPEDNFELRHGAVVDDNLIRIYPVPPPPPPPILVSYLNLDAQQHLLFGSGGTNGNEIYVWAASNNGPTQLVRRYWCNRSGDVKTADPDVGDNGNAPAVPPLPPTPFISSDGQYLYLIREYLDAQSDVLHVASVISYKVSSSGELHKTSNEACRGIDLTKLSLLSTFVTSGAH